MDHPTSAWSKNFHATGFPKCRLNFFIFPMILSITSTCKLIPTWQLYQRCICHCWPSILITAVPNNVRLLYHNREKPVSTGRVMSFLCKVVWRRCNSGKLLDKSLNESPINLDLSSCKELSWSIVEARFFSRCALMAAITPLPLG